MKNFKNKFLGILLGGLIVFSSMPTVMALEEVGVNTETISTIEIETPATTTTTPSSVEQNTEITESNTEQETLVTTKNTSTNKHLKDDLYDGNILVDENADIDGVFDKLVVKGRDLVENVRRAVIPWLVLSWIVLFAVSILRILTGERGASSRLVGGLLMITIAYCGIVYAELIISGMVKFFVN